MRFSEEGEKTNKKLLNEASCERNNGSQNIPAADAPPQLSKYPECISDLQQSNMP